MINPTLYIKIFITICLTLSSASSAYSKQSEKIDIREYLSDGNERNFNTAVEIVMKERPEGILPLITGIIIKGENHQRRDILIQALEKYDKIKILDYWLEILEKTGSIEIKSSIIKLVNSIGSRKTTATLTKLLSSRFTTIRREAASVLKKYSDDRMYLYIIQLAESSNPLHRLYAVDALMQLYDKRLYMTLIELLKDENKSIRIYVLKCILNNDLTESLPHVRKTASSDKNIEVIIEAVKTIRGLNDKKSQYLLNLLAQHNDSRVRKEAIKTLRELNFKSSAIHLSILLQKEEMDEIREEIIEALMKFRNSGNINGLKIIALSDKNIRLRIKAVNALGIINSDRDLNIITDALKDTDYRVRAEACNSLGMFRVRLVQETLLHILTKEKIRYVKTAALYSIDKLDDRKALSSLFNIYTDESDPVFKDILKNIIIRYIKKYAS